MIAADLDLRASPDPLRPAVAWFIPGDRPEAWIEETRAWGVPAGGLAFYPLPRSRADPRAAGVLVVPPPGAVPRPSRRTQPYGLRGKLFLPVEGRIFPDVADAELDEMLGPDIVLFHPGVGLVGFGRDDALGVRDLLAPPAPREASWDRAAPGAAPLPRLITVRQEEPPRPEVVLAAARSDIGSRSVEDLEAVPGEPSPGLAGRAWRRLVAAIARLVLAIPTVAVPPGTPPGALSRVRGWASRKLREAGRALDEMRHREIQRLLRLLDADPDEGLRYALPVNALGSRGLAPPGTRLPARTPDFGLAHLAGGGPADPWAVREEIRRNLAARYRALANREIELSRHRRAAYILAELLNDLSGAAAALKAGGCYREAASLYRDRLNQPLQAARCLEEGGCLGEAIIIYEDLLQYEPAGNLYARLEQGDWAVAAYRKAALARYAASDLVGTARILEQKVGAVDEALHALDGAHPEHPQAAACAKVRLDILGRAGRHDEARRFLGRLVAAPVPRGRAAGLAEWLALAAKVYPDPAVGGRAMDAVRVIVGRTLPGAEPNEAALLGNVLAGLDPDDRLLLRDVERYRAEVLFPAAPSSTRPGSRPLASVRGGVVVVREIERARQGTLVGAAPAGDVLYTVHRSDLMTIVCRRTWKGSGTQAAYWIIRDGPGREALLEPHADPRLPVLTGLFDGPPLTMQAFAEEDAFPHRTPIGTPPWAPERPLAFAYGEAATAWVLARGPEAAGGLQLSGYSPDGRIVATHDIGLSVPEGPPDRGSVFLLARRESVFVAAGDRLVEAGWPARSFVFPSPVLGLSAAAPYQMPRLAASLEEGGVLVWAGVTWGRDRPFGAGMPAPLTTFTWNGTLVAVAAGEGRTYDTRNLEVSHRATFPVGGKPPVALVPGPAVDEFAMAFEDGSIRICRVLGDA